MRAARRAACVLKLVMENESVRVSWRPFMAACEAVYPLLNPVAILRSGSVLRGPWYYRHLRGDTSDATARGMIAEAAAAGAGAERCARQLRAAFYDRRKEMQVLPYLQRMIHRDSTALSYHAVEALLLRYDTLTADPCTHGFSVYGYIPDSKVVEFVLRRCRLSMGTINRTLNRSLELGDGVFMRCVRWAERWPDVDGGGDESGRVPAAMLLRSFADGVFSYCDSAVKKCDFEAVRAIAESPSFGHYADLPDAAYSARTHMLKYAARSLVYAESYDLSDETCDLLLQALEARTRVATERLYECAAASGVSGRQRLMHSLLRVLRDLGGVGEFVQVDRDSVAASLLTADGWKWKPRDQYLYARDAAADLVCFALAGRQPTDTERCVMMRRKAKHLRVLEDGTEEACDDESEYESDGGSGESESESESENAAAKPPDAKRAKLD